MKFNELVSGAGCIAMMAWGMCALASELPQPAHTFMAAHCMDCHDADTRKGGLDLSTLKFDLADARTFNQWIKIHDRASATARCLRPRPSNAPRLRRRGSFLTRSPRP